MNSEMGEGCEGRIGMESWDKWNNEEGRGGGMEEKKK